MFYALKLYKMFGSTLLFDKAMNDSVFTLWKLLFRENHI